MVETAQQRGLWKGGCNGKVLCMLIDWARLLLGSSRLALPDACLSQESALLLLHGTSSLCAGLAYLSFAALFVGMAKARSFPVRRVVALSTGFIVFGGVSQWCELTAVWSPVPDLAGAAAAVSAAISLAAAIALRRTVPLPGAREAPTAPDSETTALRALARQLGQARQAAENASQAKTRFITGISHELRTPLNGLLGYAHLLHAEGGLTETQAARVAAMLDAGKHMLDMIAGVLDLSEIESGHMVLRAVPFDLTALANLCLDIVRPMAEAKRLGLYLSIAPVTRQSLIGDPVRLRQILVNLLGNAVKYTRAGAISLRLADLPDGTTLRIEVADTGPGLSSEQRRRLFQEFERFDRNEIEGAGLGLALSGRLARLMGGRMGHDDGPSGGSLFWLELPMDVAATFRSAPQRTDIDRTDLRPAPKLNVLVVDDVLMNRDVVSSILRSAGHSVTCAEGGAEAVAAATTADFDVVLIDVRMPGMDGLEATRRIRADGARGHVPVIGLTAQAFTDQIAACRAAGMDSHLVKPFDPGSLLAAVAEAAALRPAPGDRSEATHAHPTTSAALTLSSFGIDAPVFARPVFDRTAGLLSPEAVAHYLRMIVDGCETLLDGLRDPGAVAGSREKLADAAHALAGSAGMFGFQRVATLGRRFERCLETQSGESADLAPGLCAALEETVQTIRAALAVEPLAGDGPVLSAVGAEADR